MALTKEDLQDIAKVVAEANKSTQSDSYFTLAPEHRNDDCVGKDMVRGAIGFVALTAAMVVSHKISS